MREIAFNLVGAAGVLRSDCTPFMAYADRHLLPLRAVGDPAQAILDASLAWHEGPPPADRVATDPALRDMERIDRDVYVVPGRVCWFRIDDCRDLHLRVDWDGTRLRVHGDYYFHLSRNPLRDRAKRLLNGRQAQAQRAKRFTTLLYYLVYYPAFWWAETVHGRHPIHAAGVTGDRGAVVLAGPSGVGKSTLAVALVATGARLLSETFLLHQGTALWPVREPILIDAKSREWLGPAMRGLEPLRDGYVFNRHGYQYIERLAEHGEAAVVVLPRRSPSTYVRMLDADEAHQRISAGNQIVKDMRRYWAFAAVLEALAPRGLMERREQELRALTAGTRCVELGLGPQLGRAEAQQMIWAMLESPPTVRSLRAHRS